jgi:DNA polymerase III subunit delta
VSDLIVLIGPNKYALRKEKQRWTNGFKKRQGEENLAEYFAKKVSFLNLQNEGQVAPFIADKRLIVVYGVPNGKKEDIQKIIDVKHPDTIFLFVIEEEAGKKRKLTIPGKELVAKGQVQEFPMLNTNLIKQWIIDEAKNSGALGIDQDAINYLIDTIGEDQNILESEISKIATYAFGKTITKDDVSLLVASITERDVWKLMDFLGSEDVNSALNYVHELLDRGYSPQALWSMYLWMISLIPQIVAVIEEGESNPWKIAGSVRANPYSVKAILPFAKSVSREKLSRIVKTAIDFDIKMKTGEYKSPTNDQEELLSLIDRSIMTFS